MIICEKIKAIDNKIRQEKSQRNFDRQIAKNSALSSRNVIKYEFKLLKMSCQKNTC